MTATTTEPRTGGITTAEQNLLHARDMQARYAADVDDAKAGVARSTEKVQVVENWVASMHAYGAPPALMLSTARRREPAAQELAAARERLKAAVEALERIKLVVARASVDTQSMGVGFGDWYGNKATATASTRT